MFSAIWAKITGKDKRKQFPDQQGSALGRLGDYTIIFPYGNHCDLPSDALLLLVAPGIAVPVTTDRPGDGEQGEPMFFHPETNTRIIAKNDKSLLIETGEGGEAPVVINCTQANVNASESVTVDTPQTNITGNTSIDGNLSVGGSASITGALDADDVTATNNDVTLSTHGHPALNTPPTPGT